MSGYGYASRSTGKPVSIISYNAGRGTNTYVTGIEERVYEVRRPSAIGYTYTTAMKREKESRPKEVDDFITKILDEVNGPPVSVTRLSTGSSNSPKRRDLDPLMDPKGSYGGYHNYGGASYPKNVGTRPGYYEVEYMYYGSPAKSQMSRDYGDPYGHRERTLLPVYDPSNYHLSSVYRQSEIPKSYEVPRDRWPINSSIKPESPEPYEGSRDKWSRSPNSIYDHPQSPELYKGSRDQWRRSSNPIYDKPQSYNTSDRVSNTQLNNSPVKPQTSKGVTYEHPETQWSRLSKPAYDRAPPSNRSEDIQSGNRPPAVSPEYNYSPQNETVNGGVPNNKWGNSPLKPTYDQALPSNRSVDIQQGNRPPAVKPEYDHPPRNETVVGGVPNNRWGNSPLKPTYDQAPPNETNVGAKSQSPKSPYGVSVNQGATPQPHQGHGLPGNQRVRSTSPGYEYPPRNGLVGDVSNPPISARSPQGHGSPNNLGSRSSGYNSDSPLSNEDVRAPVKTRDHEAPETQKGRSTSPVYEHPPRNNINFSRVPNNRESSGYDSPPPRPYENDQPVADNRNFTSNNAYDPEPNKPVSRSNDQLKDVQPRDYGASNQIKPTDYCDSPSSRVSDNTGHG